MTAEERKEILSNAAEWLLRQDPNMDRDQLAALLVGAADRILPEVEDPTE